MKSQRLVKKTLLYFIGNLSSKMLSFLLLPLYAYYILPDDLGYFDFIQSISMIVIPLIFIAIWEAVLKFLISEDDILKRNIVISTSFFFVLAIGVVLLVLFSIYSFLYSPNMEQIFFIVGIILTSLLVTMWQYYARGIGKNKIYVTASIIGTITNFVLSIVFIYFLKMGVAALFIANISGNIITIFVIEYKLNILLVISRKNFKIQVLKSMLIFSLPLVLNLISAWLIQNLGRAIITTKLGLEATGQYAFASKFSVIVILIGSVLNMALIEESIIEAKNNSFGQYFSYINQILFRLFMSLIIIAMPLIVIFYKLIDNTVYYDSLGLFPWFLIYAVFMIMSTNIGCIFQATDKTKYQFITTLLGSVVTIMLSYILIGRYQLYGIAIAQVLGAATMLVCRYFFARKIISLKLKIYYVFVLLGVYIVFMFICINNQIGLNILICCISAILAVIINIDVVKKLILSIKQYPIIENL
jgi:O-antigen/teichoic acid export membrane protein